MDTSINSNQKRRVAIYMRVSTTEQKIEGFGLEAQKSRLLDYINNNKALNFVTKPEWCFSDTHTGSDLNREGLNKLLQGVKDKQFDSVLVFKIDRLSRSLKHLLKIFEDFEQNQVSFVSIQENIDFKGPIGKLIFQIFGAIAQFERELIKGRTTMGKITSAELGNYTGTSIPYGYEPIANPNGKGKKLAIIQEEKKWIEQIYQWYIFEDLGFGQIAKKLNDLKILRGKHAKTRNKFSPWTDKVVANIIQNTLYRGEFIANQKDENGTMLPEDKWTIVDIPPCISEFTFQQAQNVCQNKTAGKKNTNYLLSGKLRDMTIGKPKAFVGCKRYKGGFSYRRKQFDLDGKRYKVFEFPAKQMEDFVWDKIKMALKEPKAFIETYLSKEYSDPSRLEKIQNQLSNLREQKVNMELAIARIEAAYENGAYSEEKMIEKVSSKSKELQEVENKTQDLEDEINLIGSINVEVQKLQAAAKQTKYKLDKLTLHQRKILIDLFVDRIEMHREKVGTRYKVWSEIVLRFNPERFPRTMDEVRTQRSLQKAASGKKVPIEDAIGGRKRT